MTDQLDLYDDEFFSRLERPQTPREQVVLAIKRHCFVTGKSHSLSWRRAYLELEDKTGFRAPDKGKLDATQEAGLMPNLLEIVNRFSTPDANHASEINSRIPDYVPHRSDRARWPCRQLGSEVTPGVRDKVSSDSPASGLTPTQANADRAEACSRGWGVFSPVLADECLLVQCVECGAYGKVNDPSAEEWQQAFHAPSKPPHWPHGERIELLACKPESELQCSRPASPV